MLISVAMVSACGDGYRGYFIWGTEPPANDHDDGSLVIVITKAQLNSVQQVVSSSHQQQAVHTASPAIQRELARLHTTDERACEPAAQVYELLLQTDNGVQRYRSSNWDCRSSPEVVVKDYIPVTDLADFSALIDQEQ